MAMFGVRDAEMQSQEFGACGSLECQLSYNPHLSEKSMKIYTYANDHYAGHGRATVEMFEKLWEKD
jgi:hypothetical protein